MTSDAVDSYIGQWAVLRPDLDVSAMAPVGRLHRATRLMSRSIRSYFQDAGIQEWEFDVLATLRRTGPPHALAPKDLVTVTMAGSSALTHRVSQLVDQGYVTREVDPDSRRQLLLTLTPAGMELVDRVVEGHVANERRLMSALDDEEQRTLNDLLRKLLVSLGDVGPAN